MELIPTKHKEKLPKGMSYPLGAETISESLKESKQYPSMYLFFSSRDVFLASEFSKKINEGGSIEILDCECAAPWYEWRVYVRPVPSEYRHKAKELAINQALPKLVNCLANHSAKTFRFSAMYNLSTQELSCHAN